MRMISKTDLKQAWLNKNVNWIHLAQNGGLLWTQQERCGSQNGRTTGSVTTALFHVLAGTLTSTLIMRTGCSSETLISAYQTTRCHTLEDVCLQPWQNLNLQETRRVLSFLTPIVRPTLKVLSEIGTFNTLKPSGHYTYRTVVTIRTASLTFNNSTFYPHSVFMCFVWMSEQTAIISLYNINWLVFVTETGRVYCEVRTQPSYTRQITFRLKR
jgi:hypothetical protein